ncbi:hypothetical protein [Flavobacterium subsaxonicum]|uniref:50S ribosomal protein L27 n=1 Tax=Flavobacterium subsaxonicum WB 4.1-42 = DSM 21790 TaxID=1121898 RepID=A0A0A2MMJ1_9FLAO|nr:hypothetical protein [Flavobacterium subsaxonicum]KGO92663.1 hypothetical protein Q766_11100 [Flavobacterium subsaxonicum WB 4.1-42 = DSM 21790]
MYQNVLDLHSYWAFGVLGLLLIAAINALSGLGSKRAFTPRDRQISMVALIFSHIQLVVGIILVIVNPQLEIAKVAGMGGVMKDPHLRLIFVEHPLINIIAITLITIGWSKHKKTAEDAKKFKSIGYMYAIALVLLLSRIPWGQWFS